MNIIKPCTFVLVPARPQWRCVLLILGAFFILFYFIWGVGRRRIHVLVWGNFNLVLVQHIFIALIFQVIHHLLSIVAVAYSMLTGEGQLYTYMVLISETTTPGINLRWYLLFSSDLILKRFGVLFQFFYAYQFGVWRYLDTIGMKRSKAYLINGVAMFFAWLVQRKPISISIKHLFFTFKILSMFLVMIL